jgi:hypothetical protein
MRRGGSRRSMPVYTGEFRSFIRPLHTPLVAA